MALRSHALRLAPLALPLLIACTAAGPGPRAVVVERGAFNEAIQRSNSEQLLLNIVRLRYVDPPMFLELTSIASQLEVEVESSLAGTLNESADDVLGLGARVTTTRAPTVSYTPLQGEQFVRQLLTPIDVRTLVLLYHSGWAVDRLLRLTIQSIGSVRNAPSASGPTPGVAPDYERFMELTALLRKLQLTGRLQLGEDIDPATGTVELVLAIEPGDGSDPEDPATRLYELLEVSGRPRALVLETALMHEGDSITIVPRSLLATLFYAAQGVDVPAVDLDAGRATLTRSADGAPFDWERLFGDLFDVRVSASKPDGAYLDVNYRGHWFWLADDDRRTKSTFALLDQLFALQAVQAPSNAPLLTIPIGGT